MVHKKEKWKREVYGDELRKHILEFAESGGWKSIPEDKRDKWFSRMKFWGLFHQRTGQDGYFMLRLSIPSGELSAQQLQVISDVAEEYARGPVDNPEFGTSWIDLTTRQGIQLHWIRLRDVPEIWKQLEEVGISSRSTGGDAMRTITCCPVVGKSKHEFIDAESVLQELRERVRNDDTLANLPRKFHISVGSCSKGCSQGLLNDVALEPASKYAESEKRKGFNVRIGGGLGDREPRRAKSINAFIEPGRAYDMVRGIVELYFDYGDRSNRMQNRTRYFVEEHGTEQIHETLQKEYLDFGLEQEGTPLRDEYEYNSGLSDIDHADHVGIFKQSDGHYYVGTSVPVGRLTATEARTLAQLASKYSSGKIRLTRRQNAILMDVPEEKLLELQEEPILKSLSPEPNLFQRGAVTCTGNEFCSLALTETKARMARMIRWLRANIDLPKDIDQLKFHYSGCTADCAHSQTADIGLQGMRARRDGELIEAMDLGVGGRMGESPEFVTWIRNRVPADEVPGAIRNLLKTFVDERNANEPFQSWVKRTEPEKLKQAAEPTPTSYTDPCISVSQHWYPFAEEDNQSIDNTVG
jgi:ferredoxin-nitrite reductase